MIPPGSIWHNEAAVRDWVFGPLHAGGPGPVLLLSSGPERIDLTGDFARPVHLEPGCMTVSVTTSGYRSDHAFAHASEAEFARILDFYRVAWEYEPQTFPILWDLDGNVLESFAPDFYLPDLEIFVEMTTLQQRLVRKKNRKVRRLRELYPSLRIKLFYARDFRALMLKYGRSALVSELSGALGQVGPRPEESEVRDASNAAVLADVNNIAETATGEHDSGLASPQHDSAEPGRIEHRSRAARRRERRAVARAAAQQSVS